MVGRGGAHVPEPTSDDVDVDTGFQEMNGRRVSPHMRRNTPLIASACGLDIETAYALVNPKAREWLSRTGYEYGAVGLRYAGGEGPELVQSYLGVDLSRGIRAMTHVVADLLERHIGPDQSLYAAVPKRLGTGPSNLDAGASQVHAGSAGYRPVPDAAKGAASLTNR